LNLGLSIIDSNGGYHWNNPTNFAQDGSAYAHLMYIASAVCKPRASLLERFLTSLWYYAADAWPYASRR
jgi:hypothetical protein